MKYPLPLLITGVLSFSAALNSNAQNNSAQQTLQPPPTNILIDGSLKDWGDSLRYHNEEKKINYSLANDQDNLYVALRLNDRVDEMRVLNAGLTLSIDTKGKKKNSYSLTFPLSDGTGTQMTVPHTDNGEITKEEKDELLKARITRLRDIKVTGFKDIEGDMITTSNTYGIKAAIDYDDNGYLVYEAAIPLKFFHADDLSKSEWAFNFKINSVTMPEHKNPDGGDNPGGRGGMGGGGRGGMGGGGMGGGMGGGRGGHGGRGGGQHGGGGMAGSTDHSELTKSEDFWEKFYLNKGK